MSVAVMERVSELERTLGRPVWDIPVGGPLAELAGTRVLVTGARGSVGVHLAGLLMTRGWGIKAFLTDVDVVDVRDRARVFEAIGAFAPTVVFHLAGAKHAPEGELDPWAVTETNTVGTRNVLDAAASVGARVVFASTCKACDPETAYGASKLIAERMVLNAGGTVARFHNVVETSGNVFETWAALDAGEALPVTACDRYLIALEEAVALLLWAAVLPAGRYAVNPGERRPMWKVAAGLYPLRPQRTLERRRGDRGREPMVGSSESVTRLSKWLMKVTSPHEVAA